MIKPAYKCNNSVTLAKAIEMLENNLKITSFYAVLTEEIWQIQKELAAE
jgi:hypothetical protein